MLDEYTTHMNEHTVIGTVPLPPAAETIAAPTEFLKNTSAGVEIS